MNSETEPTLQKAEKSSLKFNNLCVGISCREGVGVSKKGENKSSWKGIGKVEKEKPA